MPEERWFCAQFAVDFGVIDTISHHHGVGRDHRDAYAREVGEVGEDILRAVKERLDPQGILNPGVLIP